MDVRPLGARVLVRKVRVEERESMGGVVIPAPVGGDVTCKAEVLGVGPAVVGDVGVGDVVLITPFSGDHVPHDTEEWVLLAEEDLLAVLVFPLTAEDGIIDFVTARREQ